MNNFAFSACSTLHELRAILIENRLLRLVVLPEAGGKIWQITYKPLDAPLLWNDCHEPPAMHGADASYDDVWSGGWDELFPNDEAGDVHGHRLPDHGELWTGNWHTEPLDGLDGAGVCLRFTTPISRFLAEKTILLRPESPIFEIHYRLTNLGDESFPFLFKLHPAFAVSTAHRIDFPPMTVLREPAFPGTLSAAPLSFPWPHAHIGDAVLDLRQVPDASSGALHFFYGTEMSAGWCSVTNRATGLACALRFDPAIFSSCWLFATHGGWRDLNVAVLEPATASSLHIQSLIEEGRAHWLAPGESLETTVLFSAQEGLTSVSGVEGNGRILPGHED